MSGPKRLAVFLSILWVGVVGTGVAIAEGLGAAFFFGVLPVGFLWGVAWVAAGFRRPKPSAPEASGTSPDASPISSVTAAQSVQDSKTSTSPSILALFLGVLLAALSEIPTVREGNVAGALGGLTGSLLFPGLIAWAAFRRSRNCLFASRLFAALAILFISLRQSAEQTQPLSLQALQKIADGENSLLPKQLSPDLALRQVSAAEGMLIFEYHYPNHAVEELESPGEVQKQETRRATCAVPLFRDRVFKRRTSIRLIYFDKNGAQTFSFDVAPVDCGF